MAGLVLRGGVVMAARDTRRLIQFEIYLLLAIIIRSIIGGWEAYRLPFPMTGVRHQRRANKRRNRLALCVLSIASGRGTDVALTES